MSKHCYGAKRFGQVPIEWVARIPNGNDLRVFTVLCAYAHPETARSRYAVSTIAKAAGINERAAQLSLRNLDAIGAIDVTLKKRGTSEYEVCPPSEAWFVSEKQAAELTPVVARLSHDAAHAKAQGVSFKFTAKAGLRTITYAGENHEAVAVTKATFRAANYIDILPWHLLRETVEAAGSAAAPTSIRRAS